MERRLAAISAVDEVGHEVLGFGDLVAGHILGNELLGVTGVRTAMVGSYGVPLVSLDVVLLN
jgi:hypothetical protein